MAAVGQIMKGATMRGEHVMTKCSLAERPTSCANPFSGVCGATQSALPCFKRNCWSCPAATVALSAPSYPFTTLSN